MAPGRSSRSARRAPPALPIRAARQIQPTNRTSPPAVRPDSGNRRMSASAVIDLPQPDSPSNAKVSPERTERTAIDRPAAPLRGHAGDFQPAHGGSSVALATGCGNSSRIVIGQIRDLERRTGRAGGPMSLLHGAVPPGHPSRRSVAVMATRAVLNALPPRRSPGALRHGDVEQQRDARQGMVAIDHAPSFNVGDAMNDLFFAIVGDPLERHPHFRCSRGTARPLRPAPVPRRNRRRHRPAGA